MPSDLLLQLDPEPHVGIGRDIVTPLWGLFV